MAYEGELVKMENGRWARFRRSRCCSAGSAPSGHSPSSPVRGGRPMAYEGELVKMENGRWARFRRCSIVNAGHQDGDELAILVAVELDERYQDVLDAAEKSLESYRER